MKLDCVFKWKGQDILFYDIQKTDGGVTINGVPADEETADNLLKGQQEHFTVYELLASDCRYNMAYGERSNGKTFGCLELGIWMYFNKQKEFGIIRRESEDIKSTFFQNLLAGLCCDEFGINHLFYLSCGRWNSVRYYLKKFYPCNVNEDGNEIERSGNPFGYSFALSAMEHGKSNQYPHCDTIIFDEFATRHSYLPGEFALFMNVLSTIIRRRDSARIYMMGNTVDVHCPYFREMGIYNIRDIKQGQLVVFEMGEDRKHKKLRVAIEWCDSKVTEKPSDIYFCFNNPTCRMITGGEFELDIYPHLPPSVEYRRKDIVFEFFVKYYGELYHGELVNCQGELGYMDFIFIHPKTTELKSPESDIIYTDEFDVRPNWFVSLLDTSKPFTRRVADYFKTGRVFYSDNTTGDAIAAYIQDNERVH